MDISEIKVNHLSTDLGIKFGQDNAPVKVIEYVNLRCPYCRQWFNDSTDTYQTYIETGKVQRIVKLFDKTKPGLDKGNIMHKYVPKTQENGALEAIASIYTSQDAWGDLDSFEEIATYAETSLNLPLAEDSTSAEAIVAEAAEANIIFVPTMVIGNEIFDQKITQEDFKKILDNA